jgi:Spy/CpxP family protein refolding chaperone
MKTPLRKLTGAFLFAAAILSAQQPFPPGRAPGGGPGPLSPFRRNAGPPGKWWDDPEIVKKLSLTAEQQKKMDETFQQSRLKLIDLEATLEKEEVILDSLMRGPQLDDAKILPSVDRIAQDRAELEKANARFLLAIRHVLTPEQWNQLQAERPAGPGPRREGLGGSGRRGGPGPGRPAGNAGQPPPPQE